jgi:sugar phosphate permease
MARDITIPFYVSIGTLGTCVVVPWLKPDPQRHGETSRSLLSADDDQAENYSNLQPNDTRHMLDNSNNTYETRPLDNSSTFQVLFRNILSFSQHEILVFCITGVTLWRLGTVCESFLPQYASEKFHWDLSQTTWLKLASSVGALISTVLLGPCLSHYFLQHGILAQVVNFRLAFSSLVALVISYLGAWMANSKYSLLLGKYGIIYSLKLHQG